MKNKRVLGIGALGLVLLLSACSPGIGPPPPPPPSFRAAEVMVHFTPAGERYLASAGVDPVVEPGPGGLRWRAGADRLRVTFYPPYHFEAGEAPWPADSLSFELMTGQVSEVFTLTPTAGSSCSDTGGKPCFDYRAYVLVTEEGAPKWKLVKGTPDSDSQLRPRPRILVDR